ncbi:glycine cleavage system protein GcvH [Aquibaculum sediminis]|uniref:glycine cleavage system protein GcvH n=1 Tax=Aquibaculum sediminis TaxID=3231907 RepID=UPI003454F717
MAKIYFSDEHEWVRVEDDGQAVIGITDYAQQQLGDVVFVELPDEGKDLAKGDEAAVVESVKAASEVYAAVSGTVSEANEALTDTPNLVNESPQGDGWFFKMTLSDESELEALMDEAAYNDFVKGLE